MGRRSTDVYISHVADDSTYFDPWVPKKLTGVAVIEWLKSFEGAIPQLAYEIVDAGADVRGDIVILSYSDREQRPGDRRTGGWLDGDEGPQPYRRGLGGHPRALRDACPT